MPILETLSKIWEGTEVPFLIHGPREYNFSQVFSQQQADLSAIKPGDVVALIGDFNPPDILTLLRLIDLGAVVVPLTVETTNDHEYFFESAHVDFVLQNGTVLKRPVPEEHALLTELRLRGHAGLVLFSTGTTGRPKAILHDLTLFLKRFETPRPAMRTVNFLLFDHIGGINTLFHTLFNKGIVVAPESRTIDSILTTCGRCGVEVLPTTPTFLRMMLMSGAVPARVPSCVKIVSYGTERMDQPTLDELCRLLPKVDFRQTFGMSELGILRCKSESRDSLFMKIGGEGVETRIVDRILEIRSESRMLGYLNAPSPFDAEGWYNTKDVVEVKGDFIKVVGRVGDVVNVGGLKFMASEVERVALDYPGVALVKAYPRANPITGQHLELSAQPAAEGALDKDAFLAFLKSRLQPHMVPRRIRIEAVAVGHRFKKA
jgi:acyl-CoA synthetase (AMP-forming)/AMP-acid ligase II